MHVHDVLIVGAGPSGFAVAARLCEGMPAANFTDEEHQRYHWIRKNQQRASVKHRKTGAETRRSCPTTTSTSPSFPGKNINHNAENENVTPRPDMLVLDAEADRWMAKWDRLFRTFDISHLRSPMFFHVDPAERDGLLAYAYEHERAAELREIRGCVGKEISKHQRKKREKARRQPKAEPTIDERDRKDYFVPSTPLFAAHCDCVIDRYRLNHEDKGNSCGGVKVRNEKVEGLEYDYVDELSQPDKIFTVRTNKGCHYARIVVLAVGGNPPQLPVMPTLVTPPPEENTKGISAAKGAEKEAEEQDTKPPMERSTDEKAKAEALEFAPRAEQAAAVTHAMQITTFPSPAVRARIAARRPTTLLVVGGGLTSAQLVDLAARRGATRTILLTRGALKVKPFDVGLEWVGKFRNFEQAAFWAANTDAERWDMIRAARNGGSVTPPYKKVLDGHVAAGRAEVRTFTEIKGARWDAERRAWSVEVVCSRPSSRSSRRSSASSSSTSSSVSSGASDDGDDGGDGHIKDDTMQKEEEEEEAEPTRAAAGDQGKCELLPPIDHIYYATGVSCDFAQIPWLRDFAARHPVPGCGGLPCINEDMAWRDDVPLFVAGRMASMQLGPGGGNLIGARMGAERICWSIQDRLEKEGAAAERGTTAMNGTRDGRGGGGRAKGRDKKAARFNYVTGRGSRYEALVEVGAG